MVRLEKDSLMRKGCKDTDNNFTTIPITSGILKIIRSMVRGLVSTMMGEDMKDYGRKINLFKAYQQTKTGKLLRSETFSHLFKIEESI